MKPLIVLNLKTYKEAAGKNALRLAKQLEKVRPKNYDLVIAPSLLMLKEISDKTSLTVYSQHADNVSLGAHTGIIPVEELKNIGIKGTLLNHSERKIPLQDLSEIIEACRKNKLNTIVCASSLPETEKIAKMKPDFLAYEPPELIGGDVSVTKARPDVILRALEIVEKISPETKVLCGAGVHSKQDLGQALILGAKGVLIGRAVSKARDPAKFLREMLA